MVVGDESALKVHVHTDDPGAALTPRRRRAACSKGSRSRTCTARPSSARPACSSSCRIRARPRSSPSSPARATRASSAASGSTSVVEGGQSMNPSTADILAAVDATSAPEVVVLPNNANVILSAEQAAAHAAKPVHGRRNPLDPGRDRGDGRLRRHAHGGGQRSRDGGRGRRRRHRRGDHRVACGAARRRSRSTKERSSAFSRAGRSPAGRRSTRSPPPSSRGCWRSRARCSRS